MKEPCELCPIKNTCGHAGGKPDKYQCGQRWEFNLLAARDRWWVEPCGHSIKQTDEDGCPYNHPIEHRYLCHQCLSIIPDGGK
jgi:hypothetical protein